MPPAWVLDRIELTGLQAAVAAAASSGATGLEAAVLLAASADDPGIDAVRELSPTALVILTHAEMLSERYRKAGHEQAVAKCRFMMTADRGQPFAQRGMLDRLQDLRLGCAMSSGFKGSPAGKRRKIFVITSWAASTPRFSALPRALAS